MIESVVVPGERHSAVIGFTGAAGKIAEIEVLPGPERLARLDVAVLDEA